VRRRGGKIARRGKAQKTKRELPKKRGGERGDGRKDGVVHGAGVVAAQGRVGLGRILHGLEVVGDGDDGQKRQDQHGQGGKLHTAVRAAARAKSQPRAQHRDGQKRPDEIEDGLHAQSRFYISRVWRRIGRTAAWGVA